MVARRLHAALRDCRRGVGPPPTENGGSVDFGNAADTDYYQKVYLLTGYRADKDLLCRSGMPLNDRDAPMFDPETFETNVPGLFVAVGAIAGRDTARL